MRQRTVGAAITALCLGILASLAVPLSASAHTGTLSASSQCAADGTRVITYTGSTTSVPESGAGHVATLTVGEIVPSGSTVTPATQQVTGDTDYSFTQTVPGDTTKASATAFLVWGDNAQSDPIGSLEFTDSCTTTPPAAKDATASVSVSPATCAAPGTATFAIENATWDDPSDTTDGSRSATADSDHVFADGTSTTTVTYTIPPQLDPDDNACATADATAAATTTPATCAAPGTAGFTLEHATWDDPADTTDGSRTATADTGHRFADGSTTTTVTYTVAPPLDPNSAGCAPDLTPSSTSTTQTDCTASVATVTTTTTTPTYTLDGTTWVRGADQVATTTSSRPLTADEVTACPAVTVDAPTDDTSSTTDTTDSEPQVDAPTDTSSTDSLAYTGMSDALPYIGGAALLALLAGAGLIVTTRVRARHHEG